MSLLDQSVNRSFLACVLILAIALGEAKGSDNPDTYQVNVREVRLTLVALDHTNRYVDTLNANDIAVVDNEIVVRRFRSFTRSSEVKLHVAVVVDTSESVARQFRKEIEGIEQLLLHGRWDAGDEVSVLTFGGTGPRLVCSRDCGSSSLASRLAALKADGLTQLLDVEMLAVQLLSDTRDPAARIIMVVFSDGEDTASRHFASDVIAAAQKAEIAIYAVDMNESSVTRGSRTLQWMATATGGLHLSFQREGLPKLLSALEEARAAYVVTYVPPRPTAGTHWVRVLPTRNLGLTFHCRRGYSYAETVAPRSKGAQ